ncbi:uncharacterized mitochondrial protein-like protein [Tanacetum coccineum]
MLIWKDASYFDSPSKDVGNDEPKSVTDDQKQVEDGPHNENDKKDKFKDDSSPKKVNAAGQHVNITSPEDSTSRFKLNIVDSSVHTASSNDLDSPQDMFKLGDSHTLETTHVEAMHEELLQFKLQQVWKFVDFPNGEKVIGTKWVFRNKKDKRGIMIMNKARLVAQVYVDDIIFGSTNKELCTAVEKLMKDKFQMSSMGELTFFLGLQVTQKEDGIFISQDKYLAEILKKFNYTDVKSTSTLVDLEKPLVKDGDTNDADVHLYRSIIGSLMYLTASRPDIMFACKKQTVVATSTTKAEYVATASCYGQKKKSRRKQRKETEVPQDETHHDDNVPIPSNDPLLNEKAKDAQAKEITGLKKRVQKLKRKKKSRTTGLKRLRKVGESRRVKSSEDKDSLEMFDRDDLHGDEVIVDMAVGEKQEKSAKFDEREVSTGVEDSVSPIIPVTTAGEGVTTSKIDKITTTNAPTTAIDEITLSQTLIEIKATKPKAVTTTATTTTTTRPTARRVIV